MTREEMILLALEPEDDQAAAELAKALRQEIQTAPPAGKSGQLQETRFAPRIFGVGGPATSAAGVEQLKEVDRHSNHLFLDLYETALQRQPDSIVCVGNSPVYPRLASAIRSQIQRNKGTFFNWEPVMARVLGQRQARDSEADKNFNCIIQQSDMAAAAREILCVLNEHWTKYPMRAYLN